MTKNIYNSPTVEVMDVQSLYIICADSYTEHFDIDHGIPGVDDI